jgi:hypothetical protein
VGYGLIDITGKRFCAWTVIRRSENLNSTRWRCRCDCGTTRDIPSQRLRYGGTSSCGCLTSLIISNLNTYTEQSDGKRQKARTAMLERRMTPAFKLAHRKAQRDSWTSDYESRKAALIRGQQEASKLPPEVREVLSVLRKLRKGISEKRHGEK